MTLADVKVCTGRKILKIAFIIILFGGYLVGKYMALRENQRDAAPSGLSATG
ncbi:MAG: hypothetical protein LH465_06785 [Sphingomonas bacterium]|nr:hypothetical protein [Sphingomonas bacterium]